MHNQKCLKAVKEFQKFGVSKNAQSKILKGTRIPEVWTISRPSEADLEAV